jgi:cyanophycinase
MSLHEGSGTLALIGGGEWHDGCRDFDAELLARAGGGEVVVLPTAAAFEHPERVVERAVAYFSGLGASVRPLKVLRRADAEDRALAESLGDARFVYIADGSPLHLRSALKDSALFDAILTAYRHGAVLAASGAGATVLCDPMVDPRGGAYTVGLGVVRDLAVFPYHGTAADHLRERSIDLLPRSATLVGLDEQTALIREPDATWRVAGAGVVTIYDGRKTTVVDSGAKVKQLAV